MLKSVLHGEISFQNRIFKQSESLVRKWYFISASKFHWFSIHYEANEGLKCKQIRNDSFYRKNWSKTDIVVTFSNWIKSHVTNNSNTKFTFFLLASGIQTIKISLKIKFGRRSLVLYSQKHKKYSKHDVLCLIIYHSEPKTYWVMPIWFKQIKHHWLQ